MILKYNEFLNEKSSKLKVPKDLADIMKKIDTMGESLEEDHYYSWRLKLSDETHNKIRKNDTISVDYFIDPKTNKESVEFDYFTIGSGSNTEKYDYKIILTLDEVKEVIKEIESIGFKKVSSTQFSR